MNIERRVQNLVKKHGTRDPFKIIENLGIHLKFLPYESTKGYYMKVCTNKFIVINSNLDEFSQLVVAAHELGHSVLHSSNKHALTYEKGMYFIQDYSLFPTNSIHENQANKFTAELIIHPDMHLEDMPLQETSLDQHTYQTLMHLKNTRL